ncbi:hypothetical protein MVEN_02626700 [Mycena venus]|uniref:Uncharacterized protein n=1 Tax=Mycena venus TaxID=2733690 RepID=A0A8H6TZ26_9AGAR|nr:hypothetical protein MVEN_02626700 [Mycena venus]
MQAPTRTRDVSSILSLPASIVHRLEASIQSIKSGRLKNDTSAWRYIGPNGFIRSGSPLEYLLTRTPTKCGGNRLLVSNTCFTEFSCRGSVEITGNQLQNERFTAMQFLSVFFVTRSDHETFLSSENYMQGDGRVNLAMQDPDAFASGDRRVGHAPWSLSPNLQAVTNSQPVSHAKCFDDRRDENLLRQLKQDSVISPFGPGPKAGRKMHFEELLLPLTLDGFDKLDMVSALDVLDRGLFSVQITSNSIPSALESNAHQFLGIDVEGEGHGGFGVGSRLTTLGRKVCEEYSETTADEFAKEGRIADDVCSLFPGVGRNAISTPSQKTTPIPNSPSMRPDINFYAHRTADRVLGKRPFARRENKSFGFMFYHAHDLEEATGKNLEDVLSKAVRGVFTQAYTSSMSDTEQCIVAWMGHPSLYRIAYIFGNILFISDWRSIEPARIRALLSLYKPWTSPITQGHLVRETLALASVDMDSFVAKGLPPRTYRQDGAALVLPRWRPSVEFSCRASDLDATISTALRCF